MRTGSLLLRAQPSGPDPVVSGAVVAGVNGAAFAAGTSAIVVPTHAALLLHDRVLVAIALDGNEAHTVTPPGGWSLVGSNFISAPDGHRFVLYELLDAAGGETSFTFTYAQAAHTVAATCVAIRGASNSAPLTFVQPTQSTAANASPLTVSWGSGTAVAGDCLVAVCTLDTTAAGDRWTVATPSGTTPRGQWETDWVEITPFTADAVAGGSWSPSASATRTVGSGGSGWMAFLVSVPVDGTGAPATDYVRLLSINGSNVTEDGDSTNGYGYTWASGDLTAAYAGGADKSLAAGEAGGFEWEWTIVGSTGAYPAPFVNEVSGAVTYVSSKLGLYVHDNVFYITENGVPDIPPNVLSTLVPANVNRGKVVRDAAGNWSGYVWQGTSWILVHNFVATSAAQVWFGLSFNGSAKISKIEKVAA